MGLSRKNVLMLLHERTEKYADKVALGMKTQYGWKEFTYRGVGLLSRKLAHYLMTELKVKKGDRLAILSESKPEYGACVFASVISGMITVPLDVKLTKYELKSILSDCDPSVILVSKSHLEMAKFLKEEIPSLKEILLMDEPSYNVDVKSIYQLADNYDYKWSFRSSKATAFIIYTSGTTGAPKGVEITFENMLAQIDDFKYVLDAILPYENVNILSILPMNHLFEMTVGFSTFLNFGFSIYYTPSLKPKDVLSIMREKQIEFMIVVPAFLKLLKIGIENELKNSPRFVKIGFELLFKLAKFVPSYRLKKLMFKKIHDKFGGHFSGCISGGAPLEISVGEFFERIGIKVYQGYGLSEVSPVASVNYQRRGDIASVGRPLNSFEAKIDPDTGELLLKGPCVMKGYHNQPEMTAQVLEKDGWLHTGDIAKISKEGHIYITGRIKNMIILSGGKKVFPEEVEAVLEKSPYFSEVCVLGISRTFGVKDGTEEITAVIVPSSDICEKYEWNTIDKLIKNEVKKLSLRLTAYKRPINIIVRKDPLPRTATRKVKRNDIKELINV